MAKARAPRLKVYQAQFGFHDSVVAAPNQKAALAAWGVRQDLFAEGRAAIAQDEAAARAALDRPGTPLRRAAGSDAEFSTAPGLPDIPAAPRTAKPARKAAARREAAKLPPPDRSRLDAAEARLAKLDERRAEDEAEIARRQADLDRQAEAQRQGWRSNRKAARAALDEARRAYRAAGGRDA